MKYAVNRILGNILDKTSDWENINFSLVFNKYIEFEYDKEKKGEEDKGKKNGEGRKGDKNKKEKNSGEKIGEFLRKRCCDRKGSIDGYREFHQAFTETIGKLADCKITASTQWRLAIGLGAETILENSLTLHPVYGVPFIPGSAFKGMVRKYYIYEKLCSELPQERADILEAFIDAEIDDNMSLAEIADEKLKEIGTVKVAEKEKVSPKDETVARIKQGWKELERARVIFGTQKSEGDVVFFDALPDPDTITLDVDVITNHYPDYYQGNQFPGDWMNPNPVSFLCVGSGTGFDFFLGRRPRRETRLTDEEFEDLVKLVQEALQDFGIGAKTAKGYGFFVIGNDRTTENKRVDSSAKEKQETKKKPIDRFLEEIEQAQKNVINTLFLEIDKFTGEDRVRAAEAFKKKYQKFKIWDKPKKESQERIIQKIRDILGEH